MSPISCFLWSDGSSWPMLYWGNTFPDMLVSPPCCEYILCPSSIFFHCSLNVYSLTDNALFCIKNKIIHPMLKILISKFAQYTYTDYTNSATLEDYWGGTSVPVKMPLNRNGGYTSVKLTRFFPVDATLSNQNIAMVHSALSDSNM